MEMEGRCLPQVKFLKEIGKMMMLKDCAKFNFQMDLPMKENSEMAKRMAKECILLETKLDMKECLLMICLRVLEN